MKDYFEGEIAKEIGLSIEDLYFYLIEINTKCEYYLVLEAIESCKHIVVNGKKPRNAQRQKEKFIKAQENYKKICDEVGVPFKESKWEYRTKFFYEDTLKDKKALLERFLNEECQTGIIRAKKISRIIEEIKN